MIIYHVLVDEKPDWCLSCPIGLHVKDCGEYKEVKEGEWTSGGKAPDHRCKLEEWTPEPEDF